MRENRCKTFQWCYRLFRVFVCSFFLWCDYCFYQSKFNLNSCPPFFASPCADLVTKIKRNKNPRGKKKKNIQQYKKYQILKAIIIETNHFSKCSKKCKKFIQFKEITRRNAIATATHTFFGGGGGPEFFCNVITRLSKVDKILMYPIKKGTIKKTTIRLFIFFRPYAFKSYAGIWCDKKKHTLYKHIFIEFAREGRADFFFELILKVAVLDGENMSADLWDIVQHIDLRAFFLQGYTLSMQFRNQKFTQNF